MSAEAVVSKGLKKRFGSVVAVDGIDLVVPRGARFGLIGQNGAGKTTFIKMMLAICKRDEGDVSVLGGDPDDVAIRKRVGYLPERLTIPPSFSALAFLESVARIKGIPAARATSDARDLLARVGLEEVAWKRSTGGYSKGMRQRTGLAAALVGTPDLLVLDEPTDGIDPLGRRQIRDVILDAAKAGATVFLNSHLLAETERICDHVAVLHRGRVVVSGALSVLQKKDAFRVTFQKTPNTVELAKKHGFLISEEEDAGGDVVCCSFRGTDASVLSKALHQALGDGLVVVEVNAELVELETVLEQSTRATIKEAA
ncbi:MAG: ABC transporter ATP-binding protein [Deltaproteobacteria bacterium]|nr:ABC transporter ATP-binding protein [Deltaproteobacteria bacterium]